MKYIHILGGGTFSHVAPHLAIAAPAFGTVAREIEQIIRPIFGNGRKTFFEGYSCKLSLSKMASSNGSWVTNDDLSKYVDKLIEDPSTKVIFFTAAPCDFDGEIVTSNGVIPSGKDAQRLKTDDGTHTLRLTPSEKIISKIRKNRKDIFLIGFKTTAGATSDDQYLTGLKLMKKSSCNLVLANDVHTRLNMVITPEQARYHETKNRKEAICGLVEMADLRSNLTFTRSNIVPEAGTGSPAGAGTGSRRAGELPGRTGCRWGLTARAARAEEPQRPGPGRARVGRGRRRRVDRQPEEQRERVLGGHLVQDQRVRVGDADLGGRRLRRVQETLRGEQRPAAHLAREVLLAQGLVQRAADHGLAALGVGLPRTERARPVRQGLRVGVEEIAQRVGENDVVAAVAVVADVTDAGAVDPHLGRETRRLLREALVERDAAQLDVDDGRDDPAARSERAEGGEGGDGIGGGIDGGHGHRGLLSGGGREALGGHPRDNVHRAWCTRQAVFLATGKPNVKTGTYATAGVKLRSLRLPVCAAWPARQDAAAGCPWAPFLDAAALVRQKPQPPCSTTPLLPASSVCSSLPRTGSPPP